MTVVRARKAYVETGKGQLHYRYGGSGAPVVLLQTIPFSSFIFEAVIGAMAARGYACYAFDLMGYGRSDKRTGTWMVEDYAANLEDAFDALKLGPIYLLGGHFPGMVVTEVASRAPKRIRKLVIDGAYAWTKDFAAERLKAAKPATPWTEDGANVLEHWTYVLGLMRKLNPEFVLTRATEDIAAEAFFAFTTILYGPNHNVPMFSYDFESRLKQLAVPTMVIGSPTDTVRPYHERAMELIPGAVQHLFTGINPLYQFDRPDRADEYAAVLDGFFRT